MMTPYDVFEYMDMKPFRPLRLRMQGGETHDIPLPGSLYVGIKHIFVYSPERNGGKAPQDWVQFPLESVEAIEVIGEPPAGGGNHLNVGTNYP